jgi:predicted nucleic-acid-binding protein
MLAIDKTLVARYLTGDHPNQSARAKALIDAGPVFVSLTVLLETERALRSVYGYETARIARALRGFSGLPQVTIEDPTLVAQALDWLRKRDGVCQCAAFGKVRRLHRIRDL